MLNEVFILLICLFSIEGAKILGFFPTPAISHQKIFCALMETLSEHGHDITVINTDSLFTTKSRIKEINLHNISYAIWSKYPEKVTGNEEDHYEQIKFYLHEMALLVEDQVQSDEVQNLLNDKEISFDLLIIEDLVRPALLLSHIYKLPVVSLSSLSSLFGNYKNLGVPFHPLLYPPPLNHKTYQLSTWQKLEELYRYHKMMGLYKYYENEENEMLQRIFGQNSPTVKDLERNVQLLILNAHRIWDNNKPVPPNVVYIGGIHIEPTKPLPQDLKSYLDSSKNGVIYVSFGTNTSPEVLRRDKVMVMKKVFSQLPYDVIWKWDKEKLVNISKNTQIREWIPQSDLLRHPNIKLFVTQGGLQSTDESIIAGVPLIGIPLAGDQWYNVEKYVGHEIGMKLILETLTETQFHNAIKTVIENKKYRQNIIKLREIMYDDPLTPAQRAVWWIEHVLRRGGDHLRASTANMSWTEILELQLVFTLLFGFLVISYTAVKLFKFIVKLMYLQFKVKLKTY